MPNSESIISSFESRISNSPFPLFFVLFLFLASCESELIRKQEEQITLQQQEIARQKREIEQMKLARQKAEQKRKDCNRAFHDFEKAQALDDLREAVVLYRQGLRLCPDDDVAHYELGKILRDIGQTQEAEQEFEAALRINPDFQSAKHQLESMQESR